MGNNSYTKSMKNRIIEFFKKFRGSTEEPVRATGAIENLIDNRDIQFSTVRSPISLPDKKITDISRYPVRDQGWLGICVAEAMMLYAEHLNWKETGTFTRFARRFFYSLIRQMFGYREQDGQGLRPRDAAKGIVSFGCYPYATLDDNTFYSHEQYVNLDITPGMLKAAKPYMAKGYVFLNSAEEVMQGIVENDLVLVSLPYIPSSWYMALLRKVLGGDSRHYITIYGYEKINNDVKFHFRNSWGSNWGNKGNGEFMLSDFGASALDIMVIMDLPNDLIERAKAEQYIFTRTLKQGMTGQDVAELQKRLKDYGYFKHPSITLNMGPVTVQALKAWQASLNLKPDGVFGPVSLSEMNKPIKPRAKIISDNKYNLKPLVHRLADSLVAECGIAGIEITVTGGYRTLADQQDKYNQGRTKPGSVITNAKPGFSFHNYGVAFDIAFLKNGKTNYSGDWEKVGKIGKKLGLEWGGSWSSFVDKPHFQYTAGYAINDFYYKRVDESKFV